MGLIIQFLSRGTQTTTTRIGNVSGVIDQSIKPVMAVAGAPFIRIASCGATGAAAIAATLLFFWLRNETTTFFYHRPYQGYLVFAAAALGGALFSQVSYKTFPLPFSFLTRASALGVFVYLLVEPPSVTLAFPERAAALTRMDAGYWFALGLAALSVWRPSFLLAPSLYVIWSRRTAEFLSGFYISWLDIRYMMEMSQFLALCACGLTVLVWLQCRPSAFLGWLRAINYNTLALSLAFVAIGLHLGNYFWSGYQKMVIGPNFWSWVIENQTQNMMAAALTRGVLPSGGFPVATHLLNGALATVIVPLNLIVLVAQLFAIIAPLRIRWLVATTIAYDIFHAGVYVVGGLFFWPWVWNNFSVLLCVRRSTDAEIGWLPKACCVLTILAGFHWDLGHSARLAWFDVLEFKYAKVQAADANGNWINVPVSFFMSHSYSVSHGWTDMTAVPGHYSPSEWGSVLSYERATKSGQCAPPGPPSPQIIIETDQERISREENLRQFVIAHHQKMLRLTSRYGRYMYYFRSHHHPSTPFMHRDFDGLDLSAIRKYRFVTQSICATIVNGQLTERPIAAYEVLVDVPGQDLFGL
jgi:hypothetical protein